MSEGGSAGASGGSASSPSSLVFGSKAKGRTGATGDAGRTILAGMDPKQKAEMMRLRLDIWREERNRRDVQKALRASEAANRSKIGGEGRAQTSGEEGKADAGLSSSFSYSAQASPSPTARGASPRSAPSRITASKLRDSISLTPWMSERKDLEDDALKRRDEASEEERAREDSFVVSSSGDGATNMTERTRTVTTPSGDETVTVETTTTTPTGKKTTLKTTSRSTTAGGGVRTTEKISTTEEDSKTTVQPLSPSDHKSPKTSSSSKRTTATTVREETSAFAEPSKKLTSFVDVVSAAVAAHRNEQPQQRAATTSNGNDRPWEDHDDDPKEGRAPRDPDPDVFVFGDNPETLPGAPPPPLVRPHHLHQELDDAEDDNVMVIPPLAEEEDDDDLGQLEPPAYQTTHHTQSTGSKAAPTRAHSGSSPPKTSTSSVRVPASPRVNFSNRVDEIIFFDSLENEDDAEAKKAAAAKGKKPPIRVEPLVDTTPPSTSTHSSETQRASATAPPSTTPANANTATFWSRTSEPIMTPPFTLYPSPRASADEADPAHATNMFNVAEYLSRHGTRSNSSSAPDSKAREPPADGGVTSPPSIDDPEAVIGKVFGTLQQDIDHLISQVTSIGRQELERGASPLSLATSRPESRLTLSRDDDVADLQVTTMAQKFGTSLSLLGDKTDVIIDCLERLHLRCTSLEEENAMLREALRTELLSRTRRPAPPVRLLTDSATTRRWRQAARTPPSLRAADVRIASTDLFKSDPSIPETTTTLTTRSSDGRKFVSELSEFMPLDGHDSVLAKILDRQRVDGGALVSLDDKPEEPSEETKTTTKTTTTRTVTRRNNEERKTERD